MAEPVRQCVRCQNVSFGAVPEGWVCPVCRGVRTRPWPKRLIIMGEDGVDVIGPERIDGA